MKYADNSLVNLLIVIAIIVIGISIAFLGIHVDSMIIYAIGVAILLSAAFNSLSKAITAVFNLINTILEYKNYLRNRHP